MDPWQLGYTRAAKEWLRVHKLPDRALKERIIGAVVLVVFAVLVVPVFLDGPSEEQEIVTETVTLPGQNNQERQQQTIVLQRDRSEPVPASRTPVEAESTPQPRNPAPQAVTEKTEQDVVQKAEVVAETVPAEPEPEASETGMWAVQLGSFSNKENAERLAADLRDQGFAAFLSQLQTSSDTLQRVRIGPQKDRASAEAIAAPLARSGHEGRVVPHP
jgi:DedD protein